MDYCLEVDLPSETLKCGPFDEETVKSMPSLVIRELRKLGIGAGVHVGRVVESPDLPRLKPAELAQRIKEKLAA